MMHLNFVSALFLDCDVYLQPTLTSAASNANDGLTAETSKKLFYKHVNAHRIS